MKKNVSKLILCALVAVCVCLTFSCGNKDPLSDPYSYESLMQKPFAERYAFLGEKDIKDLPDTCPQTGWYSFEQKNTSDREHIFSLYYIQKNSKNFFFVEKENKNYLGYMYCVYQCSSQEEANGWGASNTFMYLKNNWMLIFDDLTGYTDNYTIESIKATENEDFGFIGWNFISDEIYNQYKAILPNEVKQTPEQLYLKYSNRTSN